MLGRQSTTEPHPQTCLIFNCVMQYRVWESVDDEFDLNGMKINYQYISRKLCSAANSGASVVSVTPATN